MNYRLEQVLGVAGASLLLAAGCGRSGQAGAQGETMAADETFGDPDAGDEADSAPSDMSDGAEDGILPDFVLPPGCIPEVLPPDSFFLVAGDNTSGEDNETACGGDLSREAHYEFRAPETGTYRFEIVEADYDPVLHLREPGGCNEPLLDCNDDFFDILPRLERPMQAGESIVIAVDGFSGSEGSFILQGSFIDDVPPPVCLFEDLGSSENVNVMVGPPAGPGQHAGTCGGEGAGERVFRWTSPSSRVWVFDTEGTAGDSVLYLRSDCESPGNVECNADNDKSTEFARITRFVPAGADVYAFVDGQFGELGPVGFNIAPAVCHDEDIGASINTSFFGTTVGGVDRLTPPCEGSSTPETNFRWVAPFTGVVEFNTLGSNFDTVLHVRRGGCGGDPVACNDDFFDVQSRVILEVEAGEVFTISVDGFDGEAGNFTLNIEG